MLKTPTTSVKPVAIRTSDEKEILDKNDEIKSFLDINENLCPLGYKVELDEEQASTLQNGLQCKLQYSTHKGN